MKKSPIWLIPYLIPLFLGAASLKITGASTIQPIIEKSASEYAKNHSVAFNISAGGSGKGMKDSIEHLNDIGMASRSLSAKEEQSLIKVTIGFDALAIIVNQHNPLTALTQKQVADIYSGKIREWRELGWSEGGKIMLINKEIGRSTLELFEGYSKLTHPNRPNAKLENSIAKERFDIGSNLESITLTAGMKSAIGYVSSGTADLSIKAGSPIKILSLDGIIPTKESIQSEKYPIVRGLNLAYHKNAENPEIAPFIDFIISQEGQKIVQSFGFLPITKDK